MGLEFGTIPVRIRGIVFYTLTGFEQKYWTHFLSQTMPSMIKMVAQCAANASPAILAGAWVMSWSKKEHKRLKRKDPKMYENDT
ncbi:cytochrome b-c1 complex subunit 8 [Lasioglossum baleicum]|uniref:cytochrome b-c1 complex subunit 8 n=1 Tax=Lasioglossum baleicum TaxID=434251 RepID=UPI003FCD4DC6